MPLFITVYKLLVQPKHVPQDARLLQFTLCQQCLRQLHVQSQKKRCRFSLWLFASLCWLGQQVKSNEKVNWLTLAMTRYKPLDRLASMLQDIDGCRRVQVLIGGKLVRGEAGGQFYAPTVLVGVTPGMRIWKEEVFGPVMVIVKCGSDDEAVRLANDCPFGLGSAVFSRSTARARSIGAHLEVSCTM